MPKDIKLNWAMIFVSIFILILLYTNLKLVCFKAIEIMLDGNAGLVWCRVWLWFVSFPAPTDQRTGFYLQCQSLLLYLYWSNITFVFVFANFVFVFDTSYLYFSNIMYSSFYICILAGDHQLYFCFKCKILLLCCFLGPVAYMK